MQDDNRHFQTPYGPFQLERFPRAGANSPLRAWDAADQFLLEHLHDERLQEQQRILLLNDQFGALALALNNWHPQSISDSFLSQQACRNNLQDNQLPTDSVTLLDSLTAPEGLFDTVLIKIPKTLALLEDQLYRLRPHITATTRIIGAAMVKEIHTSTLQLFEKILGPTHTSLARKKPD